MPSQKAIQVITTLLFEGVTSWLLFVGLVSFDRQLSTIAFVCIVISS